MGNAFVYRMPNGIPGNVNRMEAATIEAGLQENGYPFTAFGVMAKLVAGIYRPLASGDTPASVIQGFLVRPYPVQAAQGSSAASQLLGAGTPPTDGPVNILKRGYMTVKVTANGGTALAAIAKGDAVYICNTTSGARVVGDIEAGSSSSGGTNAALSNAFFMGPADTDGNCEIAYNI